MLPNDCLRRSLVTRRRRWTSMMRRSNVFGSNGLSMVVIHCQMDSCRENSNAFRLGTSRRPFHQTNLRARSGLVAMCSRLGGSMRIWRKERRCPRLRRSTGRPWRICYGSYQTFDVGKANAPRRARRLSGPINVMDSLRIGDGRRTDDDGAAVGDPLEVVDDRCGVIRGIARVPDGPAHDELLTAGDGRL